MVPPAPPPCAPPLKLYLGGFYTEETAAAAYDLAAVRLRGAEAQTNFPLDWYAQELAAGDQVRSGGRGRQLPVSLSSGPTLPSHPHLLPTPPLPRSTWSPLWPSCGDRPRRLPA